MAVNEKSDNLEYYNAHPEETASGVEDFLDYLKINEMACIKIPTT